MIFLLFVISLLFNLLLIIYGTETQTTHDNHPPFVHTFCFTNKGNYTANSIYSTNLNKLLSSLPSYDNGFGFYNSSRGQNPNKAYAIGLCRGDVTPDDCGSCLSDVTYLLTQACPFQKEAIGWYQNCMLRFSNRSLHGALEVLPAFSVWHAAENVLSTEADAFNWKLTSLLKNLRRKAAAGGHLHKFAAGSARLSVAPDSKQTIYAMVQCTPDLSQIDCKRCLLQGFGYIPKGCSGTGRLVNPSCNLRFELSLFFNSPAAPLPLPVSDSPLPLSDNTPNISQGTKNETLRIVITSIIAVAAVVGVLVVIICYHRFFGYFNGTQLDFDTVKSSTGNFAGPKKLGEGGFGSVYKGWLNGKKIAVKRLFNRQGDAVPAVGYNRQGDAEFLTEVSLLVQLQHRNLVKLLGFSVEGTERLLVYEFLPNGSLDRFISDPDKRADLDWDRRKKIIVGIARGLDYLHNHHTCRTIHRDLKPSNILLDAKLDPKIADFGMARLFTGDQREQKTRRIVGTWGYMAPEYAREGIYSAKSDIYSLGVLILETLSGKRNSSFVDEGLVSYVSRTIVPLFEAWNKWRAGKISELIDTLLTGSTSIEIMRCIKIGLLCVQDIRDNRPTTGEVIAMLTDAIPATDTLRDPVPPEQDNRPTLGEVIALFANGSSEGSSNFVNVPAPVPTQVPELVSSNEGSGRTRLDQSSTINSIVAVPESPQPVISANSNSDSGIVLAAATLQIETANSNIVEHEAHSILAKLVTAPFSIASTMCEFLRGLVGWNNEARTRKRITTHVKNHSRRLSFS